MRDIRPIRVEKMDPEKMILSIGKSKFKKGLTRLQIHAELTKKYRYDIMGLTALSKWLNYLVKRRILKVVRYKQTVPAVYFLKREG